MAKQKAALTYRDGVGLERCVTCHAAVRAADGAPVAMVRVEDLETLAQLVFRVRPRGAAALLERLAQAAGHRILREEAVHG
jgi:hypothetical protein